MRRSHALVVAAVLIAALAACGSSPDEKAAGSGTAGGQVATLETAAPKASAAPAKKKERPRERLDTSPEEFEAMLGPYYKCMKEQGVDVKGSRAGGAPKAAPVSGPEAEKLDKASKLCEEQFYPLPPWERDPANPEARDFALGVVDCLKEKGIRFVEVADDGLGIALGGEKNDSRSISRGLELMPECERAVAAEMKD